jgi:hypothetical protein
MKPEEQKILNEFLSKTLKIDEEQIAGLYNEAGELQGLQVAYDADAARITRHRTENSNQFNRGLKEGASKIEKEIKEKYSLDSELIGVELVDAVVLSKVEEATKGATKDISKHPEMLKARSEWEKEQKARDKVWQDKLDAKDKEFAKTKLSEKIRAKALIYFDEFKPILPGDPNKAASWKNTFLNEVLANEYQESDDDFIPLDKEGKPLTNAHGYGRTFKEYVKEIADKYFEYQKSENRSSSGNKNEGGTGSNLSMPKTVDEYERRLKDPNITPKERIELVEFAKTNLGVL